MPAPTVAITDITPDPRSDAVSTVTITFSEAVTGLTRFNFTLTLDGVSVPLTAAQTVATSNNITWTLNGMSVLTHRKGSYQLTLSPTPTITAVAPPNLTLATGDSDSWSMIVAPWDKVADCFRSAHVFHQAVFPTPTGSMATLSLAATNSLTQAGTQYLVTLASALPPGQDYIDGDWVEIRGQTGASNATGLWEIEAVTSTTFKLKGVNYSSNGSGGTVTRWHARRWDSLASFSVCGAAKRGHQPGQNDTIFGNDTNFYVSNTLTTAIKMVQGAGAGLAYSGVNKIRLTVPAHGYTTGQTVEVAGVRMTTGEEIGRGWWPVTVIGPGPDLIDLDGSVWPAGGTCLSKSGIVQTTANAISTRAALLGGGANNASATPITTPLSATLSERGYAQGYEDYRKFLEDHSLAKTGYYFSGSAVGTPHESLERGVQCGYPMALVQLDKEFTNNWTVSSSANNSSKLQVTIAGPVAPNAAWIGKVRVALFGHSNPTYCIDQYLDKLTAAPTGLRRVHGVTGTVTASANTHTITDTFPGTVFPSWLVGEQLYLSKAGDPNDGQFRTIKSVSGNTLQTVTDFTNSITVGTAYRAGCLSYTIDAVSGATITLRTPFRGAAGSGGVMMLMGNLASGVSIVKGSSKGGGLFYTKVTTEVAHCFVPGDFVVILGTSPTSPNSYNLARSGVVSVSLGVAVHKVHAVGGTLASNEIELETTWVHDASDGRWYGTCLVLLPSTTEVSTSERVDEGRIDSPDFRLSEVRTLFLDKQKALINDIFLRHGPRHISFLDELSFRHSSSAITTFPVLGGLSGETTDEAIARVGELGDWLRTEWCRQLTANSSGFMTRDAFSSTQIAAVRDTWGGLMNEGACAIYDRSVWQMNKLAGYLGHLDTLLQGGGRYYYAPQDISEDLNVQKATFTATTQDADGRVLLTTAGNLLYPLGVEGTGAHNHSGSVIGIYGAAGGLNGVHRIYSRGLSGEVTLETRFVAGMTGGGTIVYHNYAPPMKIVSLGPGTGSATLVTTSYPHYLPWKYEDVTQCIFYGFSGAGLPINGSVFDVERVSDTTFLIPGLPFAGTGTGLCFFCHADTQHFIGLSYMLWKPNRAIEYSSGTLSMQVNTRRAYFPTSPALSVDPTDFQVTPMNATVTSVDPMHPKDYILASGSNFTDAVLGEQVLCTFGSSLGKWRRVDSRTATSLVVDAPFDNNIIKDDQFVVGKCKASQTDKILQLTRTFNGGTRRVEVYPQKCQVLYVGFP